MRNTFKKTKLNSVNKQKTTIFVSQKHKQMIQKITTINHQKLLRAMALVLSIYKQIANLKQNQKHITITLIKKLIKALRLETNYQKYSLIPKY
ncbi:hypothetical protein [Antarctic microvirus CAA_003_V_1]|nr:hypothetical protein [Antarctic microvirus CAA_003_V_1]